jgi:hypothetical protein
VRQNRDSVSLADVDGLKVLRRREITDVIDRVGRDYNFACRRVSLRRKSTATKAVNQRVRSHFTVGMNTEIIRYDRTQPWVHYWLSTLKLAEP